MSQAYYEDLAEWLAIRLLIQEDIEEDENNPDYQAFIAMQGGFYDKR